VADGGATSGSLRPRASPRSAAPIDAAPILEIKTLRAGYGLVAYDWPGNVRQLQNVIERLVNMTDVDEVDILPSGWLGNELKPRVSAPRLTQFGEIMSLEQAERLAIRLALEGLNVTRAADVLGITRPTLTLK
jgi:transcriptional regulator with PAS, ATPase and Fis domain